MPAGPVARRTPAKWCWRNAESNGAAAKKVLHGIPGYNANAILVGASLLAMVVNDNAGNLTPRGVLQLIASRLAATEDGAHVAMPLKKTLLPL